jgi:tetratricopeptide (TPR) repeat protein
MVVRFILILALVAPRMAEAQGKIDPQAQVHLDAALKAYEAKDWDAAIREFEQAYALDPKPALLYATAQAYRFANRCGKAIELYRRYLTGKLTDTQIAAAKTGISLCEPKEAPAEPKPEPRIEPKPEPRIKLAPSEPLARPAPEPSIEPAPERRPWYTDGIGDALTAGGVVGIAVGATFLVMAGSSESAAKSAQFRDDFLRDLDDATQRKKIGWTSLGVGSALAVGGVLVYVLRDRGHHDTAVVGTDGRAIYISGAF